MGSANSVTPRRWWRSDNDRRSVGRGPKVAPTFMTSSLSALAAAILAALGAGDVTGEAVLPVRHRLRIHEVVSARHPFLT